MPMDRMVGEAYILMRADGTLLERDMRSVGKKAAKGYAKEFDKELKAAEAGTVTRFRTTLAQATAQVDFSRFRKEFGSVEDTIAGVNERLDEMVEANLISEKSIRKVEAALGEWGAAQRVAARDAQALADQQKSLTQFFKDQEVALKLVNKAEKERADLATKSLRQFFKDQQAGLKLLDKSRRDSAALAALVARDFSKALEMESARVEKAILEQDKAFYSYAQNIRFSIDRDAEPAILRLGRRLDDVGDRFVIYGDKVGRVFGKGSRNNFFNILGRSVGALVGGPMRLFVETAGKVSQVVGIMGKDFRLARLDGLVFGAAMGKSLQGALKAGLPGLAALAAGIAALAVILPTTVALLFTLAGALTAVVGAITLGVLAGLLALVPVIGAVGGALVVMGVAFARAGKEGTRAARAVESLKDSFRDFGESVKGTSDAVVEAFAGTAEKLLSQMTPFFVNMGEALADVAKHFGTVLDDPNVKNFITEFSTVLPRVFENFGKGMNNMLVGLLGFFSAILGPVEQMSQGFLDLGERFRAFTSSAEGRNKIADWFDTAWGAAEDLWTILGNVFTILGKIFTSGTEGPGQGFLDYLVEVTDKFDRWLSTPEGKTAIEDFFVRVEEFMITAKDAIEEFGKALDELDTDKAAQDAQAFADAMGSLATGISTVAGWLTYINIAIGTLFDLLTEPYSPTEGVIGGLMSLITVSEPVRTAVQDMITGFESLKTWFSENFGIADSFAESALVAPFAWAYDQLFGHSWIPDIVNGFSEWIPQIPGIIAGALLGVGETLVAPFRDAAANLLGILSQLPGQILGFIIGIPGQISRALASVVRLLPQPFQTGIATARTALSAFPGQVSSFISGIPGRVSMLLSSLTSRLPSPFQSGIAAARGWLAGFPGMVSRFVSGIPGAVSRALSGLAGAFSAPFAAAYRAVSGWVSAIRTLVSGINVRISSAVSRLREATPFARGGIVYGATNAIIGEAGREAVVPLDRPLNMVDPSVRALSAIAQGMKVPAMAAGGVAGGGRQIDVTVEQGAVQVVTKTTSPNVVGSIVLDGIADAIYTAVNG